MLIFIRTNARQLEKIKEREDEKIRKIIKEKLRGNIKERPKEGKGDFCLRSSGNQFCDNEFHSLATCGRNKINKTQGTVRGCS